MSNKKILHLTLKRELLNDFYNWHLDKKGMSSVLRKEIDEYLNENYTSWAIIKIPLIILYLEGLKKLQELSLKIGRIPDWSYLERNTIL